MAEAVRSAPATPPRRSSLGPVLRHGLALELHARPAWQQQKMSRRYDQGSTSQSRQLGSSEHEVRLLGLLNGLLIRIGDWGRSLGGRQAEHGRGSPDLPRRSPPGSLDARLVPSLLGQPCAGARALRRGPAPRGEVPRRSSSRGGRGRSRWSFARRRPLRESDCGVAIPRTSWETFRQSTPGSPKARTCPTFKQPAAFSRRRVDHQFREPGTGITSARAQHVSRATSPLHHSATRSVADVGSCTPRLEALPRPSSV